MASDATRHAVTPLPIGSASSLAAHAAGPWAVAMADLTLELHSNFPDVEATIAAVAAAAVKILPRITAAGVVRVGKDGVLSCLTASNPQVLQLIQAEHRTGGGPCLDVLDRSKPAKVLLNAADGDDQRWRPYAAEALDVGVAAIMAVRLDHGAGAAGHALLLVADRGFDPIVIDSVDVFAAHAAVALAQARKHSELVEALHTRDVIGRAKGILMQRHQMTSSVAFTLLTRTSQNSNTPLRRVAERITAGEER